MTRLVCERRHRGVIGGLYDCKILPILQTNYKRRQEDVMTRLRGICETRQGSDNFVTAKFRAFCTPFIQGGRRTYDKGSM